MISETIIDNCFKRLADGECDRLDFYYEGEKQAEFHGRVPGVHFLPPSAMYETWTIRGHGWDLRVYTKGHLVVPFDEIRETHVH